MQKYVDRKSVSQHEIFASWHFTVNTTPPHTPHTPLSFAKYASQILSIHIMHTALQHTHLSDIRARCMLHFALCAALMRLMFGSMALPNRRFTTSASTRELCFSALVSAVWYGLKYHIEMRSSSSSDVYYMEITGRTICRRSTAWRRFSWSVKTYVVYVDLGWAYAGCNTLTIATYTHNQNMYALVCGALWHWQNIFNWTACFEFVREVHVPSKDVYFDLCLLSAIPGLQ